MNREIKFRVYDKDFKKMRYLNNSHDFICFDENGNGHYHNMQTGLGEWFSDLMQYVGLKDKNGVEIYENMILDNKYIVLFENCKYILKDISNGNIIDLWRYMNENRGEITKEYSKI